MPYGMWMYFISMVLATPFVEYTLLDFPYCRCHSAAVAATAVFCRLTIVENLFHNTYIYIYILIPFHKYLVSKVQSILIPFHVNSGTHWCASVPVCVCMLYHVQCTWKCLLWQRTVNLSKWVNWTSYEENKFFAIASK